MEGQTSPDKPEQQRRGPDNIPIAPPIARVRDDDLEPHAGLRYIARLFKVLAVLLALLLVAEVVVGLQQAGAAAFMPLLVEGSRILVLAGSLWAAGDLAIILIESNHDLRATRILLGRLNSRMERQLGEAPAAPGSGQRPPADPGNSGSGGAAGGGRIG